MCDGREMQVVEVVQQYDSQCSLGSTCYVTVHVPTTMHAPVYLYYRLENYYQVRDRLHDLLDSIESVKPFIRIVSNILRHSPVLCLASSHNGTQPYHSPEHS